MKIFFVGLLTSLLVCANAQTKNIAYKNGTLTITPITTSITKIVYTPTGFTDTFEISDAVVLQPSTQKIAVSIKQTNTTININNTVTIVDANSNNGNAIQLALSNNEKIFGGGERALPLNRRGYAFALNNNPWYGYSEGADALNYSVPFFTSSNNYSILFNNPAIAKVDIGKTNNNIFEYTTSHGAIIMYVITGNTYASVLQQYHLLTGKQPLPPKWALGNFMSRFGYRSTAQTDSIYAAMKAAQIPMDAIIFDLFWFGDSIKKTMGNLQWVNKKAWPNPAAMIANYKKQHIQTILITEPFVLKTSTNYAVAKTFLAVDSTNKPYNLTDFYFGEGGIIDIFRTDAANWFWQQYEKQNKLGVAGWWGDLGEPEKHPSGVLHNMKDWGVDKKFPANAVHNLYGHAWTKMLFTNYAKYYPNTRLFSLNRSGFAGTQRYSIFPWTGDVSRSWSGLKAQLPILQGMSISGVPYVHSDAGGFAGGNGDYELYIRWLQMAAFTPIFRPHGTALYDIEPAAFSFPSEPALMPEPYKTLAKNIVIQRYQWLPYNYNLAYLQATKAAPLITPLYYMHPTDSNAYAFEKQYYWGQQVLVAPVLEKNATTQQVYLPQGYWFAANDNKPIVGGTTIEVPLTIQQIPVFVKAGSFIPVYAKNNFTTTAEISSNDTIALHYYPSNTAAEYRLFNDDGVSKNSIVNKNYSLLACTATTTKSGYVFRFQQKNKPSKQQYCLVIHSTKPTAVVTVNGKKQTFVDLRGSIQIPFTVGVKPLLIGVE